MTIDIAQARQVRQAYYAQRPREGRMSVSSAEIRASGSGDAFGLAGYASVTNAPYEVSDWAGSYEETVRTGAFAKSLQERDDVRLLVNHDGVPLARTGSGTLDLREITDPSQDPQGRGQTGLWCEANLDASSPLAQTVRSAMARGDLTEMSVAFRATRQSWDADYTRRDILEAQLFDVSVVTYPANPATTVQLNSARVAEIAGRMREGRALDPQDVSVLTQALGWLSAIDSIVDQAQDVLADYVGTPNLDDDDMAPEPGEMDMTGANLDETERRRRALALARLRAAA